MIVKILKYFAA